MCGIFTIGSSTQLNTSVPDEAFFSALNVITGFKPDQEAALCNDAMESLREATCRMMRRGPQLALMDNQALKQRLSGGIDDLSAWLEKAEAHACNTLLSQPEEEALNFLITGARDTVWQIRQDLMGNVDKIQALAGGLPLAGSARSHLWHLNMILNNLDRLEVRGRDSAGIAAYLYFPDAQACQAFLQGPAMQQADVQRRQPDGTFFDGCITRPTVNPQALLFTFKVAEEVGEIGQNVACLRGKITGDAVFQQAIRQPEVRMNAIAHTRWASNGIISVPNCHPVDSTLMRDGKPDPSTTGNMVAVLNGDIDNYQDLRREILTDGADLHPAVTTDAKIIPILMAHLRGQGLSLEDAFNTMVDRCEGSMAIALLSAERPDEYFLAQKGSGQGLFLAQAGSSVAAASEMYGTVELTDRYVKADGEKALGGRVAGERFHVSLLSDAPMVQVLAEAGASPLPDERTGRAEITTRDIERGDFPRYLLKEITESVQSVEKTFRGKLDVSGKNAALAIGEETLSPEFIKKLEGGGVRRIITTGQGTAAIAAEGIAFLLADALARTEIQIDAQKATELSSRGLRDDMSDTLVIAVSQSGTTTDTNRTVDLARGRGATIIGIVNRRNSDLVYKSNGVLYTSDGRDIEMSVASTKAFYAQNTAGQLLALALAEHLKCIDETASNGIKQDILSLPAAMQQTLALSDAIREVAKKHAPCRRYWAIVGSGPGKIAADEIRIKLSELCYKAIAVDFLEDKKHIDLSSEPMIIVCATGLPPAQIPDAVKEVAIFKAHNAIPIVITDVGEDRFTPYAASCIQVPRYTGALRFLLPTMVGHLFGYHSASCFEETARRLRTMRKAVVQTADAAAALADEPLTLDDLDTTDMISHTLKVQNLISAGKMDSVLETSAAIKLNEIMNIILNRMSMDLLPLHFSCPPSVINLLNLTEENLSEAINQVSRPIDAIKHQAKTVTVGISRFEGVKHEGAIWSLIDRLKLPVHSVPAGTADFLTGFSPLLQSITGATLYDITGLNPLGVPTANTQIQAVLRDGIAGGITSRFDAPRPLAGTKMQVAKTHKFFLGFGSRDQKKILILPFITESTKGRLLLIHFDLLPFGDRAARINALKAYREQYDRVVAAVTERDVPWMDGVIDKVDNTTLFLKSPDEAAAEIISRL